MTTSGERREKGESKRMKQQKNKTEHAHTNGVHKNGRINLFKDVTSKTL
jgi:hypothetical protein